VDDFLLPKLDLEWTFIRVPQKKTYSLEAKKGSLRLHTKPGTIENRKRFSMIGFRQRESDFEYQVKMEFAPKDDKVESGIIHYQKEWNYLSNTVYKENKRFYLEQRLKEKNKINEKTIKRILLKDYKNDILFKVVSKNDKYTFYYSLNNGENFKYFTSLDAIKILDRNYTGALLGVFSTSNGNNSSDYADYDWVRYHDFVR
jgi:alpha-N-arabinofuranosidase